MENNFDVLYDAIEHTIKEGAAYSDIYIQSGEGHSLHFEDGKFDGVSSSSTEGSGGRVIVGGKTYFAHAPGAAVSSASDTFAESAAQAGLSRARKSGPNARLFDETEPIEQPNADFIRDVDKKIRKESKYIRQSSYRYSASRKKVLIIKPNGSYAFDERFYSSFAAQVVVEKDGVLQTGYERRCMSSPADVFMKENAPFDAAANALRRALLMLDAAPCPAGTMNVLMDGEAGGTIVHEACGHGLEADIVEKDFSVYRGRLGEKVADECVTMIDEATKPGLYGSYAVDDEGTPAGRTVLIENGVLKRYLTDILSSKLYGMPTTGNGRRESYRSVPMPRMSNTYLTPGKNSLDEMLSRAGNGLYVKKMGGGEVDPTSGDFVFYVTEGYLIKNGKITAPVRGAILTGNGPEALSHIAAIGDNLVMDPGVCGKSGQSVPVTDGQPSMLIEGLTVGGSEA